MSCSSDLCFWAGVSFERVDLLAVIGDIACRLQPCCRFPARFSLVECSFFLFHELVEFMEVDISEYRGDDAALWRTTIGLMVVPLFDITGAEHIADEVEELL